MSTCSIIMFVCNILKSRCQILMSKWEIIMFKCNLTTHMLHLNMIILHVDMNKMHVNVITCMLHVDIACRGHKYATIGSRLIFKQSFYWHRAVENYGSSVSKSGESTGFSVHAFFSSLGNFVGIFTGAFAIGSLIGCITALISF